MLALLLLACTGTDAAKPDDTAATDDTATTSGGLRTLANCGTDVAGDVPAFYAKYFRCVTATVSGTDVTLTSVDLPPHTSPYWGEDSVNYEPFDDRGGEWHQNPNLLSAQSLSMTIAAEPVSRGIEVTTDLVDEQAGTSGFEYGGADVTLGLNLDGVALFHGVAAPGDDINEEQYTFDSWEGHPEGTGIYHHHSANPAALAVLADAGLVTTTTPGEAEVEVYGMMCDGTVVLGCTELDGSTPDTADFDAQAGHVHDLVDEEGTTHFAGRYHVHVCAALHDHAFTPEIQYYEGCR